LRAGDASWKIGQTNVGTMREFANALKRKTRDVFLAASASTPD